jgi:uncharacterized protein YuzE
MKLTYDLKRNIAYFRLHEKKGQVDTVRVSEELNVDMAPDGTVYGIELLNANAQLEAEDDGNADRQVRMGALMGFGYIVRCSRVEVLDHSPYLVPIGAHSFLDGLVRMEAALFFRQALFMEEVGQHVPCGRGVQPHDPQDIQQLAHVVL